MELTYLLSQVFIVIAYSLFGLTYFAANRKTILVCNSFSLVAEGIGYVLLFAWSGVAMVIIAGIRNVLFFGQSKLCEKKPELKKYEWVSLVIVWMLGIFGAVITWNGILGTFAIIACMIYTFSIWQKSDRVYDVLGIFSCIFLLIYNIVINSLFGIILEAMLLAWVIFAAVSGFNVRDFRQKRNNKKKESALQNKNL